MFQISDNGLYCDDEIEGELVDDDLSNNVDDNVENLQSPERMFRSVPVSDDTACTPPNGVNPCIPPSLFQPVRKRKNETQFISLPCKKLNPEDKILESM